jgi:hypothetical protein
MKESLGFIAVALTFIAFLPYIRSIQRGETKPHVFSWVIWGLTTFVVFLGQIADGGGAGAWAIGVSGLITVYVAWLAYTKKADVHITKVDWIFFILAIFALPLWYINDDPLWTVVILTSIDALGFGSTFRKSYHKPFDEQLGFYVLMTTRNGISIAALAHYSITTVIFPALTGFLGLLFILMLLVRRAQVGHG